VCREVEEAEASVVEDEAEDVETAGIVMTRADHRRLDLQNWVRTNAKSVSNLDTRVMSAEPKSRRKPRHMWLRRRHS
jgi:hypothetical protein